MSGCFRNLARWRSLYRHPNFTVGLSSVVFAGFCSTAACQAYNDPNNHISKKETVKSVALVQEKQGRTRDDVFQLLKQRALKGKEIFNGLLRFGHAAVVVVTIVIDYKKSLISIDQRSSQYKDAKSACHKRSAIKLRDLCIRNGGVFIKVGQHLGALDFLLPDEYVTTLRVLHNEAAKSPFENVCQVIEEELQLPLDEVFQHLDPDPIGAASLAQVHHAVLKDGRKVAVKVQHKEVKAHANVDMATIELLVKVVALLFPEFRFQWLVEEMKRNIPLELDFIAEGKNCNKVEAIFRKFPYLKVPKIHWDVSAQRLLTMEFCEGGAVDDVAYYKANGICSEEVSAKLGRLYSEMIFVQGFVHCDPHPGNILVRKSKNGSAEIVLLDHGSYQNLTDDFRVTYCKLWQSLISGNIDQIRMHSEALGVGDFYGLFACMLTARSWDSINAGIQKVSVTEKELQDIQSNVVNYIPEITEVLNRVPRQMILILKTNDLLRGIDSKLKTKATSSSFVTMLKCCVQAIADAELRQCNSITCRLRVRVRSQLDYFRITVYQFSLTPFGQRTMRILASLYDSYRVILNYIWSIVRRR